MSKNAGRPRAFDKDDALNKALGVFCLYGYEGASLSRLTEAMGINSPSLYAAFGDKEALFLEALDAYFERHHAQARDVLFSEPDTYRAFCKFLEATRDNYASGENMTGCLIVNSTINNNSFTQVIADRLKDLHNRNENMLQERLEVGKRNGDVPRDINTLAVARYINGILQGSAVLIRGQQSKEAVTDLINQSLIGLKAMLHHT